jgi:hypothetical protein
VGFGVEVLSDFGGHIAGGVAKPKFNSVEVRSRYSSGGQRHIRGCISLFGLFGFERSVNDACFAKAVDLPSEYLRGSLRQRGRRSVNLRH